MYIHLDTSVSFKVGKDINNWDNLSNPVFFIWTVK